MTRRSKRVQERTAAGKRPASKAAKSKSNKKKRIERIAASRQQKAATASTNDASPSVAKETTTPPPPKRPPVILQNPYSKKKPPPPPPPPPVEEDTNLMEDEPSIDAVVPQYYIATCDEGRLIPGTHINPTILPQLPMAVAAIPMVDPMNRDGTRKFNALDFEQIVPSNITEFSLHSIMQSIADNPIMFTPGTKIPVEVSSLSTNTKKYDRQKKAIETEFFQALKNHPSAAPLADMIEDPDDPGTKRNRFYIETRAPPSVSKHRLINWCCLIFAMAHVKKRYRGMDLSRDPVLFADAQYEPNVFGTHFRMLFATFRSEHITYTKERDFNGLGQLNAYLNEVFRLAKLYRFDYGTLPNKADFDEQWYIKRANAAADPNNPFDPYNNIEHYVWACLENVMVYFCLRGGKEPWSICVEDFEQGIIDEGEFEGIPYIRLKETYQGQKGKRLTTKNPVVDAANTKKKTFPCPYNTDPLSCYQTLVTVMKWMPPPGEHERKGRRLFRQPASQAQRTSWQSQGLPYKLNPNPSKVIGKNHINDILKKIAKWCNYKNATHCTGHGKRQLGISEVCNRKGGVAPATLKMLGGHADINMVARYHRPNQTSFDDVIRAKAGSPTAIRKQMDSSKPTEDPFSPLSLTEEELDRLLNTENLKQDDRKPAAKPTIRTKSPPDKKPLADRSNGRKECPPEEKYRPSRGRSPSPRRRSPSDRKHSSGHYYSPEEYRSRRARSPEGEYRSRRGSPYDEYHSPRRHRRHSPRDNHRSRRARSPEGEYRSRRTRSCEREYHRSRYRSPEEYRPRRESSYDEYYSPRRHRRHSPRDNHRSRRARSPEARASYREEILPQVSRSFDGIQMQPQPQQQGYFPPQQRYHQPPPPQYYRPGSNQYGGPPPYHQRYPNGPGWI